MTVDHDRVTYKPGAVIPCTDEQAAQMLHAVEKVEPVKVEPALISESKAQPKRTK